MQELSDLVSAIAHHGEPALRDRDQFVGMLAEPAVEPEVDGGIVLDCAVESQQVRTALYWLTSQQVRSGFHRCWFLRVPHNTVRRRVARHARGDPRRRVRYLEVLLLRLFFADFAEELFAAQFT